MAAEMKKFLNRISEPTLCRIGHAYEEATGWYKKHPNV
jgi:hypothetical protein